MLFQSESFFRHVLQVDNLKTRSYSENYQLFHKQYSIGKFQEWYKKCCGRDGRIGLMRFMALLTEFCELSEHQAIQIFHKFDLYQNGRLDATDIYLIFSLMIANAWNLRVLFLHQHHTNIIPYLQLDTGDVVSLSELLNLVNCAGVQPFIVARVLQRLSKHFAMESASIFTAINFLFACFLEQDKLDSKGEVEYDSIYSKAA